MNSLYGEPSDNLSSQKTLGFKPTPRAHLDQSLEPSYAGGFNEVYEISPIKPASSVYGGEQKLKNTKVSTFSQRIFGLHESSKRSLAQQELEAKK